MGVNEPERKSSGRISHHVYYWQALLRFLRRPQRFDAAFVARFREFNDAELKQKGRQQTSLTFERKRVTDSIYPMLMLDLITFRSHVLRCSDRGGFLANLSAKSFLEEVDRLEAQPISRSDERLGAGLDTALIDEGRLAIRSQEARRDEFPPRSRPRLASKEKAQFPIFFATNRARSAQAAAPVFGTETAEMLSWGILSGPEHPSLAAAPDADESDQVRVLAAIQRAARPRRRKLLIYVHGWATPFSKAAEQLSVVKNKLSFEGPILLFAWPSGDIRNYLRIKDRVAPAARRLAEILRALSQLELAFEVSILAHSMGADVVTQALDLRFRELGGPQQLGEVLFVAGDVSRNVFIQQLYTFDGSARVSSYSSKSDLAMLLSSARQDRRIGNALPDVFVCAGVDSIDVTQIGYVWPYGHSYHLKGKRALTDIKRVLAGHPLPRKLRAAAAGYYHFPW
jgi:esterase/lipase superfamily enzyme